MSQTRNTGVWLLPTIGYQQAVFGSICANLQPPCHWPDGKAKSCRKIGDLFFFNTNTYPNMNRYLYANHYVWPNSNIGYGQVRVWEVPARRPCDFGLSAPYTKKSCLNMGFSI
jgi:hypothetical protein